MDSDTELTIREQELYIESLEQKVEDLRIALHEIELYCRERRLTSWGEPIMGWWGHAETLAQGTDATDTFYRFLRKCIAEAVGEFVSLVEARAVDMLEHNGRLIEGVHYLALMDEYQHVRTALLDDGLELTPSVSRDFIISLEDTPGLNDDR